MHQRLDDRTGAAIRVSATEREQQRQNIVAMLGALAKAVDRLSGVVSELESWRTDADVRISENRMHLGALTGKAAEFYGQTFWQRMRWLMTGR